MGLNQTVKTAANTYITERSGTNKTAFNDSIVEGLRLYIIQKGGTPATTSINDLVNQATAYYFVEQSVTPAPRGNDALFKATELYLTAKSQTVPRDLNGRILASATYFAANGSSGGVIAAPFTTVLGPNDGQFGPWVGDSQYEGWSADYSGTPSVSSPIAFTVSRQGYDTTGSATTYLDTMYVTTRVRQPAPNDATLSTNTVALSDYIYSTDTPSGSVTNNSTLVSPKPICKWALPSRRTVGNSVTVQVVTGHRNARLGKQVACVAFTATSLGTGSATVTSASPKVLGYTNDRWPVIGYEAVIDVTGLSDNTAFTVDAVVYPWIGASTASQRRSVDGTASNYWEFSTQTYLKNTSKAASPPLVYVNSTTGIDAVCQANGTDAATGLITKVSTSAAAAKVNPFATVTSALNALKAATTVTGGFTDGCEVRIQNSTVAASSPGAGTYQSVSEVTFTRDPDYARSACILTIGGAVGVNLRSEWVRATDLSLTRAGSNVIIWTNQWTVENCDFDNASFTGQMTASSARTMHLIGNTVTNWATGVLSGGTSPAGIVRGNTMTNGQIEGGCLIGNTLTGTRVATPSARGNNSYIGHNKGVNIIALWAAISTFDIDGLALIQNQIEWISSTSNPVARFNADAANNNTTHVIMFNNTWAGASIYGRHNVFYDEAGTARRHKLNAMKNEMIVQLNNKGDFFQYYNNGNPEGYTAGSPSRRLGNWPIYYGVGCESNWTQYQVASVTGESQVYPGRGSSISTTTTSPQMANDKFTDYQATTYTGAVLGGAGGGTYTLDSDAPIKGAALNAYLSHDSAGTARPLTGDSIGAYI